MVITGDYLKIMRVVGVKQLKARLSEYLREVRRGEVYLVTDRDQVVAELRPPRAAAPAPADELAAALEALIERGDVQAPRLARGKWVWRPTGIGLPGGTAQRILDELRAERGPA
ncbi:MAG: type II toxin-antitoxin system prevent-host-death family antitoxin [Gemmatimonadetes bacterium]|nr:type II toxin-antitoxin system prevent-host-death family antitoxin [Gemmatimonadota bacterium]